MSSEKPGADSPRMLRFADVIARTGLSRTTLWRLERVGAFPKRIRLGANSVGWIEEEVDDWINSRPRGMAAASRPGEETKSFQDA